MKLAIERGRRTVLDVGEDDYLHNILRIRTRRLDNILCEGRSEAWDGRRRAEMGIGETSPLSVIC